MAIKEKSEKDKDGGKFFQTPRGMHDVLPGDQIWWEHIGRAARELADFYNFGRIDTPILEYATLFRKGIGEETDIIDKEMYILKTKGGDVLALRPEGTAPVARAYLQNHLSRGPQPQKLWYEGPMFRHENPQAGRLRQFTQIGFEVIGGTNDPIYDAQIIIVFQRLLEELKIKNVNLKINSIGCRVCRPLYKRQLQNAYRPFEKKICKDCQGRLKTNPLRLLDCKKPECQEAKSKAPNFLDKLCVTCNHHLQGVLEYLEELQIPYGIDNQLVRGLDYYSRTVFEFYVDGPGSEVGALPGGGRYDYLMELLGGRLTPAVGGAVSYERLIPVLKAQQIAPPARSPKKVFMIHVGELAKKKSVRIIEELRAAGISVAEALGRDSLKAQLKQADKDGIELALIFGQKEIFEESIIVRNLKSSLQESVPLSKLIEEIKKRSRS
ncbi:MAG TPA: histidine--tRNA ligase [Candidatus Paceibacterota bacterium]|nr:histidine--tRNA ligase [Candidatus Paceibacterota bacterium]